MAQVAVFDMSGKEVGKVDLSDAIFGVEVNEHLLHKAVTTQLANSRQGTQKAKTRSEVSGGGKKPWRQKGTGHARQGSTRAPQWKMNKKEKRIAMKSALTSRVSDQKLIVLDSLKLDEIKTKRFAEIMKNLGLDKALVVLNDLNTNVIRSAKNIPDVKTTQTNTLNVYDILKYQTVVLTRDSLQTIEEVYA